MIEENIETGDVVITDELDGERLDRIIAIFSGVSRNQVQRAIELKLVTVNSNEVTKASFRVELGSVVSFDLTPVAVEKLPTPDSSIRINVVFEDQDIVVIDKPTGLVVHPGAGTPDKTLVNGLLAKYPELSEVGETHRPGIVHRIDKGTSGLLVVARNQSAYRWLVQQLSSHAVDRRYVALLWGVVVEDAGTIDAPLARSLRNPLLFTVNPSGKKAVTHFKVRERFIKSDLTLMEFRLETGRTHQIRVHAGSIGHPVMGDASYRGIKGRMSSPRMFLHAEQLEFLHPSSRELVRFQSTIPSDLQELIDTIVREEITNT